MNFLYRTLSNVLNSYAMQGVIYALHHVLLFMDGAWLLLMPVKTALDLQLLQSM